MKKGAWILLIIVGLAAYGKWDEEQHREKVIAEHRFHLAMPANDVVASMGPPLAQIADPESGGRRVYWDYPQVVIEMVDGVVVDSRNKK